MRRHLLALVRKATEGAGVSLIESCHQQLQRSQQRGVFHFSVSDLEALRPRVKYLSVVDVEKGRFLRHEADQQRELDSKVWVV